MNPTRNTQATLVDLLDRVLDKGLILDADLIIRVAGVPLLGVKLKAALAGMETMLRYGIWQDWDEAQRAAATAEQQRQERTPLAPGEKVMLETFASHRYEQGLYHGWRPGQLYVTDRRVLLFRKEPAEILFQCPHEEIRGVSAATGDDMASAYGKNHVDLMLESGAAVELRSRDAVLVESAIKEKARTRSPQPSGMTLLPTMNEAI